MRKCASWAVVGPNYGGGTRATGSGPCTADGWRFAFGGTEEWLVRTTLGLREIGAPADYASDRRTTGTGWVRAHDGDYADALRKGYGLTLCATETSGGVNPTFDRLLRAHDRLSREPGTQDYTRYGTSRASPSTYRRHHLAAHAAAVVYTDAATLLSDAASKSFWLARGQPEHAWPSRGASHAAAESPTGDDASPGGNAAPPPPDGQSPHGLGW